jgi:Bacterial capsule synthesis protein PGA_cap
MTQAVDAPVNTKPAAGALRVAAAAFVLASFSVCSSAPEQAANTPEPGATGGKPTPPAEPVPGERARLQIRSTASGSGPFKILFGGDTHFEWAILDEQRLNPLAPVEGVRDLFAAADYRILNLETTLSDQGEPYPGKAYIFNGSPEQIELLSFLNINLAVLGNNHSMDMSGPGVARTIELLRRAGIVSVGAGRNLYDAGAPLYFVVRGKKFALFSYNLISDVGSAAGRGSPGTAGPPPDALQQIRAARREADHVIVSLHWGHEYQTRPDRVQIATARSYIDAGALAVVGHHPHVPQGVEIYRNGVIAYSLGNFLFGSINEDQTHNIIMGMDFNADGALERVRLYPLWGEFRAGGNRARLLSASEARPFWHDFYWQCHDVSPASAALLRLEENGAARFDLPVQGR